MNSNLIERILIQLQPDLAQEFANAILEDRKKVKALETISDIIRDFNKGEFASAEIVLQEITNILSEVLL